MRLLILQVILTEEDERKLNDIPAGESNDRLFIYTILPMFFYTAFWSADDLEGVYRKVTTSENMRQMESAYLLGRHIL